MDRYEVMAGKMAPLTDGAHRSEKGQKDDGGNEFRD